MAGGCGFERSALPEIETRVQMLLKLFGKRRAEQLALEDAVLAIKDLRFSERAKQSRAKLKTTHDWQTDRLCDPLIC